MSKRKKPTEEQAALAEATLAEASRVAVIERELINWPEITGKNIPVKHSLMNASRAIEALGLNCRHDIFHNRLSVNGQSLQSFAGDLSDPIVRKIRELSFLRFGYDPGVEATRQALLRRCEELRFHPIRDYLDSLKWDRMPRLDRWLTTYLGVEDTPLVRAQGRIVLMAAVARIYWPGTKFDHVLVLEGPEGARKSSVVQVLANGRHGYNENFSDSPVLAEKEQKQMELTCGVWFYELAELAGMKKGDQYAIKNFVTKQEERARAAYAFFQTTQPRTCIFIGSFNTAPGSGELIEYLNVGDQRRWWPVRVGEIDIAGLERDRDQLFAEAVAAFDTYRLGLDDHPPLYLPRPLEDEARGIASAREIVDPLADTLGDLYASIAHMMESRLTPGGANITVEPHQGGNTLTKGSDALPFAHIDDERVWVSSAYVVERAPTSRKADGKGIGGAMRKLGWATAKHRGIRGWLHKIEAEPMACE